MSKLQEFIKNRNLELTLFNEHGESVYVGPASDIIPQKSKHLLKFPVKLPFTNVSPLTLATLHSGRRIFTTLYIKPVFGQDIKTIELVFQD